MTIEHIHIVRKPRNDGQCRYYYYTYRGGGLQFWTTENEKEPEPYCKRFTDAYLKAYTKKPKPNKSVPGTVNALIDMFIKSDEFQKTKPDTQKGYREHFPKIRKSFGRFQVKVFERQGSREKIRQWHKSMAKTQDGQTCTLQRCAGC